MTRQTAQDLTLVPAAGPQAAQFVALDQALLAARQLQAETLRKHFDAVGRLVSRAFRGLALAGRRRRMIDQLSRLDDRMLSDIGLERGNLVEAVDATLEKRAPSWAAEGIADLGRALVQPLVRWQRRQATLAELAQLDARMLADIGISRAELMAAPDMVLNRAEAANRNRDAAGRSAA